VPITHSTFAIEPPGNRKCSEEARKEMATQNMLNYKIGLAVVDNLKISLSPRTLNIDSDSIFFYVSYSFYSHVQGSHGKAPEKT